jgi:GxxExxY protein
MMEIEKTVQVKEKKYFPHKDLTYKIIGVAMNVHKELGPGFLEAVYHEALTIEFSDSDFEFKSEVPLELAYKGIKLKKKYRADFIVDNKVLVELKQSYCLSKIGEIQVLNYLNATGYKVGLLLNFGQESLQWKRIVY